MVSREASRMILDVVPAANREVEEREQGEGRHQQRDPYLEERPDPPGAADTRSQHSSARPFFWPLPTPRCSSVVSSLPLTPYGEARS